MEQIEYSGLTLLAFRLRGTLLKYGAIALFR